MRSERQKMKVGVAADPRMHASPQRQQGHVTYAQLAENFCPSTHKKTPHGTHTVRRRHHKYRDASLDLIPNISSFPSLSRRQWHLHLPQQGRTKKQQQQGLRIMLQSQRTSLKFSAAAHGLTFENLCLEVRIRSLTVCRGGETDFPAIYSTAPKTCIMAWYQEGEGSTRTFESLWLTRALITGALTSPRTCRAPSAWVPACPSSGARHERMTLLLSALQP